MKTEPFDPVEFLKTDEDRVAYLLAAVEESDPAFVGAAIGDVIRSVKDERDNLCSALECCQKALEMMVTPAAIRSTTVLHAWASAVAAEAKARAVLELSRA